MNKPMVYLYNQCRFLAYACAVFIFFREFALEGSAVKRPKNPISYSVVILTNEKSEILLLKRQNTSFANGLYGLPGSHVESGETALKAAQREVQEELGITVDNLELVHVLDRQGAETEFYIFAFKAGLVEGIPVNNEPHKCSDLSWFHKDRLPENMMHAHKQMIECASKGILYSEHGWE